MRIASGGLLRAESAHPPRNMHRCRLLQIILLLRRPFIQHLPCPISSCQRRECCYARAMRECFKPAKQEGKTVQRPQNLAKRKNDNHFSPFIFLGEGRCVGAVPRAFPFLVAFSSSDLRRVSPPPTFARMSLFSSREWWEHKPSEVEECDKGCLAVGNVDNEPHANGNGTLPT